MESDLFICKKQLGGNMSFPQDFAAGMKRRAGMSAGRYNT